MRSSLMDDRRFRALSLAHRGAYATLIDEADAAGVYASAAGSTLRQTIARALGCSEAEGDAIVADLRAAGALDLDGPTLVLLVGTGAGACGGRPKALLMRASRARSTGAGGNSIGNRSGNAGGNVAGNTAVTDTSNSATADATQVLETTKESGGEKVVTDHGNTATHSEGDAKNTVPPSASLPSPLSHTLSSLTLPPSSPPPSDRANAGAREEPPATTASKPPGTRRPEEPDTVPLPGTLARRVHDAIAADPKLGPRTKRPGDFAIRVTNPDAFPGVDVLAAVLDAGLWLSKLPGRKCKDGRGFLRNWLRLAATDAATTAETSAPKRGATKASPEGHSIAAVLADAAGDDASLDGTEADANAFAAFLARLNPTPEEVAAMGAAMGDPSAWWPANGKRPPRHVTLHELAGYRPAGVPDWGPLSALVGYVRAEAARAQERERPTRHVPQSVLLPSPEEVAKMLADARATGPFRRASTPAKPSASEVDGE